LTTSNRTSDSSFWILFTLWLLVFGAASQVMILAPILPRISEELGVSVAALGTLATIYAVSLSLFALFTGPISDRIGRRRILLAGASLLTLALALHAVAHSFAALLLVRGLAGAGGGVLSGAAVAFVGDYFPSNRRGWANSWIMSGIAAGQIAGIPLGALLAGRLGFQAPFLLFAAIMATATMLVWIVIPQLPIAGSGEPASVRAALRGYLALLRRPAVVVASIAFLLIFLSISLYMMYLPVWLEASLGFSGLAVALVFLVGGVSNVLAGPRAGRLSDDVGRKPVIIGASTGLAVVMLATPLAALWSWTIYALFAAVQALLIARASPFQSLLSELVATDQRGSLLSLTLAIGQLGFGLGGAVAGFTYSVGGFGVNATLAAFSALLSGLLIWRYLPETLQREARVRPAEKDPCAPLRPQGVLCGPCPEAGHMPRPLQEACAQRRAALVNPV
jgi:predicted MFS family arabinose efflux permease